MRSLILQVATRLLVGLILVFAVYLLFRGHNAPGGGFSAALVAGTGFALFGISEGPGSVRSAIRIDPRLMTTIGLGIAILSGSFAGVFDKPFLTGIWWVSADTARSPLAVGSPLFFDIGVFFVVLGTVLTIILALEED